MGKVEDVERAAREHEYLALENDLHAEWSDHTDVLDDVDEEVDE